VVSGLEILKNVSIISPAGNSDQTDGRRRPGRDNGAGPGDRRRRVMAVAAPARPCPAPAAGSGRGERPLEPVVGSRCAGARARCRPCPTGDIRCPISNVRYPRSSRIVVSCSNKCTQMHPSRQAADGRPPAARPIRRRFPGGKARRRPSGTGIGILAANDGHRGGRPDGAMGRPARNR